MPFKNDQFTNWLGFNTVKVFNYSSGSDSISTKAVNHVRQWKEAARPNAGTRRLSLSTNLNLPDGDVRTKRKRHERARRKGTQTLRMKPWLHLSEGMCVIRDTSYWTATGRAQSPYHRLPFMQHAELIRLVQMLNGSSLLCERSTRTANYTFRHVNRITRYHFTSRRRRAQVLHSPGNLPPWLASGIWNG